jgi:hypothetical protein
VQTARLHSQRGRLRAFHQAARRSATAPRCALRTLGFELGVEKLACPFALEPCALTEFTLSSESEALKESLDTEVPHIREREQTVHREPIKGVGNDAPDCLRCVPVTLMGSREGKAKLCLARVTSRANRHVPDECTGWQEANGELKPSAGRARGRALQAGNERLGFEDRVGNFPVLVDGDFRVAAIGRERLGIGQVETPNY